MSLFLGIDGGGTRTTAWLANERGKVLGRGEAGPSNPLKSSFAGAKREILRAAHLAAKRARLRLRHLDAVCLGIAGGGHAAVRRHMLRWIREAIPSRAHIVTTDANIALAAAFGQGPGIILIAGTGSIVFARDDQGRIEQAGGWGSIFDDAGSGYDIGRKAIAAVLRSEDGRGRPTSLRAVIIRKLRLRQITDAIVATPGVEKMAEIFPLVQKAALRGDRVARLLLESAALDLADLVIAPVNRLGWKKKSFTVACAGGVLRHSARIRSLVEKRVLAAAPRARVVLLRREPVEGALFLASRAWRDITSRS